MLSNIKAVIFDMDGLLLDTEILANQAVQKTSVEVLGLELPESVIIEMIGMNEADSNRHMSKYLGKGIPGIQFAEAFYRHYSDILSQGICVKDGGLELLDFLEEKEISKAIATSTKTELAFDKLNSAGVETDRFSYIVGGDQINRGKPSPDIYLLAAQKLKIAPEDCLALEDSYNGVKSASTANMNVICIPDIKPPCQEMKNLSIKVLQSLHEVKEYMKSQ